MFDRQGFKPLAVVLKPNFLNTSWSNIAPEGYNYIYPKTDDRLGML
jgi:hypothetical protein